MANELTNIQLVLNYVKTTLGITWTTEDQVLTNYIQGIVAMIKQMTWIDVLATSDEITELYDGAWQRELFLKWKPIASITSISENTNQRGTPNWNIMDNVQYVSRASGEIDFHYWLARGFQNIKVVYKVKNTSELLADYNFADLFLAIAMLAWNIRSNQETTWIASESVSGTTITFAKQAITNEIQTLLNKFITIAI